MKVKYLGTLFAASVLSLGLVTSCATPEAGETEVDPDAGVVEPGAEVDPDAGVVEPGAEVDPDAGVVEPGAEVDPDAGQ